MHYMKGGAPPFDLLIFPLPWTIPRTSRQRVINIFLKFTRLKNKLISVLLTDGVLKHPLLEDG